MSDESMTDAPRITLYGTATCPYCLAAKMLLKKKNLDFEEIAVGSDRKLRAEMERLSGGRSVPQIFIDEKPIGGFDQLSALEQRGELDRLLNGGKDLPADEDKTGKQHG